MTSTIRSVRLPNQLRLPYVESGDPSSVPVLFLHGFTDSWRSFEPVLPHLPRSIRAFALSQRGHGGADRPATGYSPDDFASDVAAFMDALQLERAVIVGHSMGACIAHCFAAAYPERTMGLVLMGAFGTFQENPTALELLDIVSTLTDPVDPGFVREFQQSTVARPISPAFLDTVVKESLKVPARVWRAALAGLLETEPLKQFGPVKAPTLIMWGDQEAYIPHSDQEALAAVIADSRLVVYPGAGHAFHWEEPARFAADLEAFVEELTRDDDPRQSTSGHTGSGRTGSPASRRPLPEPEFAHTCESAA
jgi:pimeloyl-ACP methyl ester carboxylesterase